MPQLGIWYAIVKLSVIGAYADLQGQRFDKWSTRQDV